MLVSLFLCWLWCGGVDGFNRVGDIKSAVFGVGGGTGGGGGLVSGCGDIVGGRMVHNQVGSDYK